MPTYDYVCSNCGHRFEVIHGVFGTGPTECPNCHAHGTLRKAIAAPTIVFKGTGWAKKDRGASTATKAAAKAAAGGGDSSSGSSGGSGEGSSTSGSSGGSSDGSSSSGDSGSTGSSEKTVKSDASRKKTGDAGKSGD